jgi:hypothetical protein
MLAILALAPAQSMVEWLSPQYESQDQKRQADLQRDREQSEQHRDVPFYDVTGYHNSATGESRFTVQQLLGDLGPVGAWAPEQLDSDAEAAVVHGASGTVCSYIGRPV